MGWGVRLIIIIVFINCRHQLLTTGRGRGRGAELVFVFALLSLCQTAGQTQAARVCKYPVQIMWKGWAVLWKCRNSEVNKTATNCMEQTLFILPVTSDVDMNLLHFQFCLDMIESFIENFGCQFEKDLTNQSEMEKIIFVKFELQKSSRFIFVCLSLITTNILSPSWVVTSPCLGMICHKG